MSQGTRSDSRRSSAPRRINEAPALVLALVIAPLLTAAALAPSAAAKDKQKRPDLEITRAVARGTDWVFDGAQGVASFSFQDVTENTGKAGARPSVTAYYLDPRFGGLATRYRLESRRVSRLGPGDRDPGGARVTIDTSDLPLGAYALEICADDEKQVREEKDGKFANCDITGRRFYVVKDDWQGSIEGVGSSTDIADLEQWQSQGVAHLSLGKYLGHGVFRYDFAGTVEWITDGVNINSCRWSGSGSQAIDETNSAPGIRLKYGDGRYLGTVALNARFYTITISSEFNPEICSNTTPGPAFLDFLTIGPRDLSFNQNQLMGRFNDRVFDITWKWDFR